MKWTMVLLALAASTGDTARVKHEGKDAVAERATASEQLTKEISNPSLPTSACPSLEVFTPKDGDALQDLEARDVAHRMGKLEDDLKAKGLEACLSKDKEDEEDEAHIFKLQNQKTKQGCKCEAPCSPASKWKGGGLLTNNFWQCDLCRTLNGCGHRDLFGTWDYCDYPENKEFEAQSFEAKNKYFEGKINANSKRGDPPPSLLPIFMESMVTVFDNMRDEMPAGRTKYIHSIGSICKFELNIKAKSPYTGLFAQGKQEGFIRMGSAAAPTETGLTPGLGFKFARKGVHSGGFVGLYSLALGTTWNFFEKSQSNHIAPPTFPTSILAKKFMQASQCAPQVGLSDLARYSQDGTEHKVPKFPFKLFMVPSQTVQMTEANGMPAMKDGSWTLDQVHEFMDKFEVGTPLYKVYACDTPKVNGNEMNPTDGTVEDACNDAFELGDMVTTSKCTTSAYGDKEFHIRHQRIEEDWALRPAFLTTKGYDVKTVCASDGQRPPKNAPTADGAPPVCGASGSSLFEASAESSGQLDSDLM